MLDDVVIDSNWYVSVCSSASSCQIICVIVAVMVGSLLCGSGPVASVLLHHCVT